MALNKQISNQLISDLARDTGLPLHAIQGFVGALAMESGGFNTLQEISPAVPRSAGGYGYAQWTGPRRKAFERYAKSAGLETDSYEANYGYIVQELNGVGGHDGKIAKKLAKAKDAHQAERITTTTYLRPGVRNPKARKQWTDSVVADYTPVPPGNIPKVASKLDVNIAPKPVEKSDRIRQLQSKNDTRDKGEALALGNNKQAPLPRAAGESARSKAEAALLAKKTNPTAFGISTQTAAAPAASTSAPGFEIPSPQPSRVKPKPGELDESMGIAINQYSLPKLAAPQLKGNPVNIDQLGQEIDRSRLNGYREIQEMGPSSKGAKLTQQAKPAPGAIKTKGPIQEPMDPNYRPKVTVGGLDVLPVLAPSRTAEATAAALRKGTTVQARIGDPKISPFEAAKNVSARLMQSVGRVNKLLAAPTIAPIPAVAGPEIARKRIEFQESKVPKLIAPPAPTTRGPTAAAQQAAARREALMNPSSETNWAAIEASKRK